MFITYYLLIFVFGWFLVNLFIKQITVEEHIGLSFLLGFGIHSILYVLIMRILFYIPNNLLLLILEASITYLINIYSKKIRSKHFYLPSKYGHRLLGGTLIAASSLILFYVLIQSIYWPVYDPDAIYLYDFRARLLMGGNVINFFRGVNLYQNYLYPPFTSVMHFFIYQISNVNPKIVYPTILASLYLIVVGYVKRLTSNNLLGLIAGLSVLLTPSVLWNSFLSLPNIIYMCFISSATLYLFEDSRNKVGNGKYFIGSILLGLSIWTRSEPFWIVVALVFTLIMILRKKIVPILILIIIVLPINSFWTRSQLNNNQEILTASNPVQYANREIYWVTRQNLSQTINVFNFFAKPFWDSWGPIPFVFLGIVIVELVVSVRLFTSLQLVTLSLTASVLIGILNFSYRYPDWQGLGSSLYRMATLVVPLFWVSIFTSGLWSRYNDGH